MWIFMRNTWNLAGEHTSARKGFLKIIKYINNKCTKCYIEEEKKCTQIDRLNLKMQSVSGYYDLMFLLMEGYFLVV